MRNSLLLSISLFSSVILGACSDEKDTDERLLEVKGEKFSVGLLLPDVGMGDQSFNDLVVDGLLEARDDLDVIWSYRDLETSDSLEKGLDELIAEDHDVIIAVGYTVQEMLEKEAAEHPEQRFALIDTVSEVENVDSIVFNEKEGSYLAGVLAAHVSKTGILGFLGGFNDEVIMRFHDGFLAGARSVNPDVQVIKMFADTYSDANVGTAMASTMIEQQADVLYAAAGYTGVGLLQQAQKAGVYAIGVDSDQYFYAEKAVVTSMQKNLDVAVYSYLQSLVKNENSMQQVLEFGTENGGVGLSPIRVVSNASELEEKLEAIDVPASMN